VQQGIKDEIKRIIVISICALIAGVLSNRIFICLLIAGFCYSCWLLYQTRAFYLWMARDDNSYPPDAGGIWGDIFDIIYHYRESNQRAKSKLEQQLSRVEDFLGTLGDCVVLIREDNTIDWWNKAAESMLGLKKEYDMGKPLLNIIRHPRFINYLNSGIFEESITLPSPANANQTLDIQIGRFGNNEKVLVAHDISRLVQLEQMRKDFVANVSHELRTPLTVINGYLEPITDNLDSFEETWQKPLEKIQSQSKRMTEIITDLTTLSRMESNDLNTKEVVKIPELIKQVSDDAQGLFREKPISIKINLQDAFEIHGSRTELYSCFSNLIVNGAKYNTRDNVEISITVSIKNGEGVVSIEDNGIGIDPAHIPRLTERFYRVDNSHSSQTGGTGLGLAIVKHVLLRHNGHLNIRSHYGKGSTFSCHFHNLNNSG
jgi:two-component system phosphate regulon sensor histidine kinase PhoR